MVLKGILKKTHDHVSEGKIISGLSTNQKKRKSKDCDISSFKSTSNVDLKTHQMNEHKAVFSGQYSCKLCKFASTKTELKTHVYNNHQDKKTISCDSCSFMSHRRSNMTVHQAKEHGIIHLKKNESQSCRICDFSAIFCLLKKHYNEQHKGSKHFTCSLCDYTTNIQSQLSIHNDAIHVGKLFYCDHCDFKTSWQSYLKIHVKSSHLMVHYHVHSVNIKIHGKLV